MLLPIFQANADEESSEKKIVMASARREDTYVGKLAKLVFTEAFKRAGKELVFKFYPAQRAFWYLQA